LGYSFYTIVAKNMKIPIYMVDAFTDQVFRGNPAAVCVLESWLPDDVLQHVAFENNHSETAFVVGQKSPYELRWFTPVMEVDLCGHATLATAYVYHQFLEYRDKEIGFITKSGLLTVGYDKEYLSMVLPRRPAMPCNVPEKLITGLGIHPLEVRKSRDYLVVLDNEDEVRGLQPLWDDLCLPDCLGIIVTAIGNEVDFVSRFFAPNAGVNEDPVTGSSHSTLVPYWADRLKKKCFLAKQVSPRGGTLVCEDLETAVKMSGKAVIYLSGHISL
jgi:PhzF family phenazine biosynthesis protein